MVRYAKLARSAPGSGGVLSAVERAESVARNVAGAIKRTVTPERLGTLAGLAAVGVTGAFVLGSLRGPVSGGAKESHSVQKAYFATPPARPKSDILGLAARHLNAGDVTGARDLGSLRGPVSAGSGELGPVQRALLGVDIRPAPPESHTSGLAIARARNTGKTADNKALAHLTALIALMLEVFGTDTRVLVHNLDVKYFHIKKS